MVNREELDNAVHNLLVAADVYETLREKVFGSIYTHHSDEGKAFQRAVLAYRKLMK